MVAAGVLGWAWCSPAAAQRAPAHVAVRAPAPYQFRTERGWIRMPDGVRLAVTYWRPTPRRRGERFPVLLEYLPYRK